MKHFLNKIPSSYFLVLGTFLLGIVILIEAKQEADMRVFLAASRDIMQGINVYKKFYFGWLDYFYSPLFGLLLVPLTYLPAYWANALWLLISVIALFRILQILMHWLDIHLFEKSSQYVILGFAILLCLRLIRDNLHYHQITILLAFLTLEGLHQIFQKRGITGGAILALGINIKVMPIVFLPYLIYRRYWLGTASSLVFWAIFLLLPALFIGYDYNAALLEAWWSNVSPTKHASALDFNKGGIGAIITAMFYQEPRHQYLLFITMLSESSIQLISHSFRLFFILLTLYFLQTFPFRNSISKAHRFWEIGYLFLVTPIIFPRQQNYAFFYVLPALFYLVYYFYQEYKGLFTLGTAKKNRLILLIGLAYFALNAELLLGAFMEFYISIKLVTWGAMLLMIPYAICQPKDLKNTNLSP